MTSEDVKSVTAVPSKKERCGARRRTGFRSAVSSLLLERCWALQSRSRHAAKRGYHRSRDPWLQVENAPTISSFPSVLSGPSPVRSAIRIDIRSPCDLQPLR